MEMNKLFDPNLPLLGTYGGENQSYKSRIYKDTRHSIISTARNSELHRGKRSVVRVTPMTIRHHTKSVFGERFTAWEDKTPVRKAGRKGHTCALTTVYGGGEGHAADPVFTRVSPGWAAYSGFK